MAFETVIGQQPPQIRVAGEQDAVEVVGLALEPVGAGKTDDRARHRRRLVGLDAHADAVVQPGAQQVIDHIEALLALGVIDAANVDQAAEAALRIVAQEFDDVGTIARAIDLDGQLAKRDLGGKNAGPRRSAR